MIIIVWDEAKARSKIFSGDRVDDDENPIKSKCQKYFLKVVGNGTKKGDYSYPVGDPDEYPNRDALISAYRYAKRFDKQLLTKIKSIANKYDITFPAISMNSVQPHWSNYIKVGGFYRIPTIFMRVGIFNNVEKIDEELRKSSYLYDHIPITIKNENELGHTDDSIVTRESKIIGHVEEPFWREDREDIFGYSMIDTYRAPQWLLDRIINNDETLGVSSAYYSHIIDGKEYNYLPDNVSIVEPKNAACEPPLCGINLNDKSCKKGDNFMEPEELVKKTIEENISLNEKIKELELTVDNLNDQISKFDTIKGEEFKIKDSNFETEKTKIVSDFEAEKTNLTKQITDLQTKLDMIELERKKSEFRARFPSDIKEDEYLALEKEYLENPANLVLNTKISETYLKLLGSKETSTVGGEKFTTNTIIDEEKELANFLGPRKNIT